MINPLSLMLWALTSPGTIAIVGGGAVLLLLILARFLGRD